MGRSQEQEEVGLEKGRKVGCRGRRVEDDTWEREVGDPHPVPFPTEVRVGSEILTTFTLPRATRRHYP